MPAKSVTKTKGASRKALCIGINDYPFAGNDLNGCVNDARAWAALLKDKFGFSSADVKILLDAQATKKNSLAALKDLLAGAKAGDVLVYTNSSHGSYTVDRDGDEETYDEIICPYDIDLNEITDDDLREMFTALPQGVHLTMVLDNCHSGTATRAAVSDILPGTPTPDERRVRFLSPAVRGLPILADPWKAKPKTRVKYPESQMREVLLSGCTDKEYSYDAYFSGMYHGAMTYFALRAIREANYKLTYQQLHARLTNLINPGYDQHPQLEGKNANRKRQIFS